MSIWETAIFFEHRLHRFKGLSLTLGIDICEIPDICGCFISNTDNTDLRDVSLALGMSIYVGSILLFARIQGLLLHRN